MPKDRTVTYEDALNKGLSEFTLHSKGVKQLRSKGDTPEIVHTITIKSLSQMGCDWPLFFL